MGQSAPSARLQITHNLGGAVDVPGSPAATHRDVDWLGKRSDRNQLKFNKKKCKVLHVGPVQTEG